MFSYLFNFEEIRWLLAWESLVVMAVSLLLLWGSKWFISWGQGVKIDHHLTEEDNPAAAVTVASYFLAVGIILYHIITSPAHGDWEKWESFLPYSEYWYPLADLVYWFLIAAVLLFIAGVINDRFILFRFRNRREIIEDRNVGVGAAVGGSYLASAYIISVIIGYGDEGGIFLETVLVIFYFFCLQFFLILFSKIYVRLLPYDLHRLMEEDNPAPGIAFGLSLTAMGMILSYPLTTTGNLWVLLFWFVNGVMLLLLTRWILNYVLFRKADLNREISDDQNWGIALIEGTCLLVIALLIKSSF